MTGAEIVASKLTSHPDPKVRGYYVGSEGTVDEAAITAYLGGATVADLPADQRAIAARNLRIKLMAWTPVMGSVQPVNGTPVNAATMAAIIDRLEA